MLPPRAAMERKKLFEGKIEKLHDRLITKATLHSTPLARTFGNQVALLFAQQKRVPKIALKPS